MKNVPLWNINGRAWRRGSNRRNMAGVGRAVQRETLKAFGQSHGWLSPPGYRSATDVIGKYSGTGIVSAGRDKPVRTVRLNPMIHPKTVPGGNALSRRSLLGALATMPAVALSLPTMAAPRRSPLDELIADFALREAESDEAETAYDTAIRAFMKEYPFPVVRYGRRAAKDRDTGMPIVDAAGEVAEWTAWEFETEREIRNHFRWCDQAGNFWSTDQKLKNRQRRDGLIKELRSLQAARNRAQREAGITALDEAANAKAEAWLTVRNAIFAYRPANLAELDLKNRFVVSQFAHRKIDIEWREIALIFGCESGVTRETDSVTA
jgi:hypothetical protein